MKTHHLSVHFAETAQTQSGRADRWVDVGFDRDGDPCLVLNFDFGACRLRHHLYFDNAPQDKGESTRQFLSLFDDQAPESFDLAFEFVERYLERLSGLELETSYADGGLRIIGYTFRTNDGSR